MSLFSRTTHNPHYGTVERLNEVVVYNPCADNQSFLGYFDALPEGNSVVEGTTPDDFTLMLQMLFSVQFFATLTGECFHAFMPFVLLLDSGTVEPLPHLNARLNLCSS